MFCGVPDSIGGIPGRSAAGRVGSSRGVSLAALSIPLAAGRAVGYDCPFLPCLSPIRQTRFSTERAPQDPLTSALGGSHPPKLRDLMDAVPAAWRCPGCPRSSGGPQTKAAFRSCVERRGASRGLQRSAASLNPSEPFPGTNPSTFWENVD